MSQGKTPQGTTPQGTTPQGTTPQGTSVGGLWMAYVGVWSVRSPGNAFIAANVRLDGTNLTAIPANGAPEFGIPVQATPANELPRAQAIASGGVMTSTRAEVTTADTSNAEGARANALTADGGIVRPPPRVEVLATFNVKQVNLAGIGEARIIGTFTDEGPYGPTDAMSLLGPQYRPKTRLTPVNGDIRFYQVQYKNSSGAWENFCASEPGKPQNAAIFMPGHLEVNGSTNKNDRTTLGIVCSDGTTVKCARWGYKWWKSYVPSSGGAAVSVAPVWEACYRAAMADYCEDGVGHTIDDTVIDLWDRYGFIAPVPESAAFEPPLGEAGPTAFSGESAFSADGTVCIEKERYAEIPANCSLQQKVDLGNRYCPKPAKDPLSGTWSSCGPKGLVGSAPLFSKGQLAQCAAEATRAGEVPLVFVASWTTACTHDPLSEGPSLASDCNDLTSAVCKTSGYQSCCGVDPAGHMTGTWGQLCVALAKRYLSQPWSAPPQEVSPD